MKTELILTACFLLLAAGCSQSDSEKQELNAGATDAKAIAIADSVMKAMGGQENWENTKIISWNFFGSRTHIWNKKTDRDRIEIPGSNMIIDMNIHSKEGTVMKGGEEMTQPDSVEKYLQRGYEMWVNDSYWLLMPYKLKDGGVTLSYMGIDTTQTGIPSHKLKMTFDNVGVTPQNMYHVYVDTADYMVRQWAYFPKADSEDPRFVLPWDDYQKYGNIMLSGGRGQNKLTNIQVMDEWPEEN